VGVATQEHIARQQPWMLRIQMTMMQHDFTPLPEEEIFLRHRKRQVGFIDMRVTIAGNGNDVMRKRGQQLNAVEWSIAVRQWIAWAMRQEVAKDQQSFIGSLLIFGQDGL
jgi:hypothetical protein